MSHEKQLVYFSLFGAHLLHVFTCTNHLCFHVEHLFICILAYVIKYYNHTYTRSQRSCMHKFKQSLTSVHVSSHAWNFTPLLFTVFSVFLLLSFCVPISLLIRFLLFLFLFCYSSTFYWHLSSILPLFNLFTTLLNKASHFFTHDTYTRQIHVINFLSIVHLFLLSQSNNFWVRF